VSGLEVPWALAFLPRGDVLVTERPGRLRLIRGGKLVARPVAEVPVSARSEGGLLGMALARDFDRSCRPAAPPSTRERPYPPGEGASSSAPSVRATFTVWCSSPGAPRGSRGTRSTSKGTRRGGSVASVTWSSGPDGALWLTTSNCDGRGRCPPDKDRIVRVLR
jgi:hypothetical protein